jgi:hypothetical protein
VSAFLKEFMNDPSAKFTQKVHLCVKGKSMFDFFPCELVISHNKLYLYTVPPIFTSFWMTLIRLLLKRYQFRHYLAWPPCQCYLVKEIHLAFLGSKTILTRPTFQHRPLLLRRECSRLTQQSLLLEHPQPPQHQRRLFRMLSPLPQR